MRFKSKNFVDEPVTRSSRARSRDEIEAEADWPLKKSKKWEQDDVAPSGSSARSNGSDAPPTEAKTGPASLAKRWPTLKRAHAVSFAGLLLFTAVTYFRPYELIPALAGFRSMAYWLAVATLLVFIPTQLSAEGTLTARPRELNLAFLLLLAGLLSVPFAGDPAEAWPSFLDFAKVIAMFAVMINVVRTERRLRAMLWLALLVAIVLSVNALNDYRMGNLDAHGERVIGVLRSGLFENPNDMALHLVTMIPLAVGLLFVARSLPRKVLYGICAFLMVAAMVVTFSRGGFLGLVAASFVLVWKLGRRNRFVLVSLFLVAGAIFFMIVPSEFVTRVLSIFGGDDGGSAMSRQNLLWRSIVVTFTRPLFGVGMHNFHGVSIHEQVSHNAYTQVSAEMGIPALIIYVLFIWFALKRMRRIESDTYDSRERTRIYYLAVGLQASLIAYMVTSFFASVAYLWYIYYLAGYALCLHRLYEAKGAEGAFGRAVVRKPLNIAEESKDALVAPYPGPMVAHHER